MELVSIIASISIYAVITVFLFELFQSKVLKAKWLNRIIKIPKLSKLASQIITWIFSFIIVYIFGVMSLGTFAGVSIFYTIVIGLLTGLSANGIWTFPPVQKLLEWVGIKNLQNISS